MKKVIFTLLLSFLVQGLFAWAYVDEIVKSKVDLYFCNSEAEALETINNLSDKVQEINDEQEKLICQNLLLVEKINFTDTKDNTELKKLFFIEMNDLSQKNQKYIEENKNIDKWLFVSYSDLLVRLMSYQSSKEMYKTSMETKNNYQKALKIDSKFAYAYNSYALWLYFAPSIAGGGLDAAYKNFSKAIKYADNKNELYFFYINRSQILFKMKKNKEYEKDLLAAHELFPDETFTKTLREKNQNEKILFDS